MKLIQKQIQQLSQQQLQGIHLLQLNSLELEAFLREVALDNPVIEIDDVGTFPESVDFDQPNLRWLKENDYQNRYYLSQKDEIDLFAQIGHPGGFEETLERFLTRQIERLELNPEINALLRCLTLSLDERGYFDVPVEEVAECFGVGVEIVEDALGILRSLEPAGIGATDLSHCLQLQLERIGYKGPAMEIVRNYLELLGHRKYRAIASKLSISVRQVQQAERVIRELEPRPGSIFQEVCTYSVYVRPEIFVKEENGVFIARVQERERPLLRINDDYLCLLKQTSDKELQKYLSSKLQQANLVQFSLQQRESTLKRCADAIVAHQQDFFRFGPQQLEPLLMTDLANELEVHESTVSRAVREKYLQCSQGIFPLRYFFSRSVGLPSNALSNTAVQSILQDVIEHEDKTAPLSDQKLMEELARRGHCISRRTVTKYREEMGIQSAFARKSSQ